jgi:putative transposase
MPNYRRAWVPGGTYFFTVAIAERSTSLLVDRIDDLRAAFRAAHAARPFVIDAIVILPDHLHCLWTLPVGDADYSVRWAHIKTAFSRRVPKLERLRASRVMKRERGLWQRRYWEHLVRDEDDFRHHVDYIHFNPVRHGLVVSARDWPYSSFHRFVRDGRYPMEWGQSGGQDAHPT